MGLEEEIEAIEEEIANTPYNKSTEEHIGRLKAKLAEKKEELQAKRQSGSGGGHGYAIEQTGDATVALVGFPSVGKSTLLNTLTNAESEVGDYEFTTLEVNPGMLQYKGANIQLLDVPGLVQGAASGRGEGREVLSVIRTADIVLFLLSPFEIEQYERLREELYNNNVRLDATPPAIRITEKGKGGIDITKVNDLDLSDDVIKEVLREHGIVNADVTIRENIDIDQLVDSIMDNRVYVPSLIAVNKMDLVNEEYIPTVKEDLQEYGLEPDNTIFLSAKTGEGIETLKQAIWEKLSLIRIYMDKPGRGVDYEEPLIVKEGATVGDACKKLGGKFTDRFRFARVTGPSADHDNQQVGKDHTLQDEDILRVVLQK